MRTYMIYLLLTGKRLLRQLPYFLAGLAVMVLLVGMAAFSASKVLYGETSLKKIEVGVVLPEDDALSEKITKMIASLDSVESLCDFSYLEHDEAFQKMKSGELQAVFEVPSGMARGILDGPNQPATIWFPDESGLEGAVFRELAESGSSMLGTSQAAIYAANECLNIQGVPEQISVSEQDLNRIFLKYAMNREALFRKKTVSAAGNVSTAVFYGISGIVFLMILTGIPAFIAASVVRCTADRANDDIVIFRKRLVAHGTLDAFIVQNRTSKIRLAIFERRSEYCQNYFLIHIILQNARNRNAKRANFQTVNNSVRKRNKTSRKANIKISAKPCVFPHFFYLQTAGYLL